jgi:hypothetical protein
MTAGIGRHIAKSRMRTRLALDRLGDDPGPGALEAGTGHDAVLEPEQSDQGEVDDYGEGERARLAAAVDGDRHPGQVADESDQIEEGGEEQGVGGEREQEIEDASHKSLPGIGSIGRS